MSKHKSYKQIASDIRNRGYSMYICGNCGITGTAASLHCNRMMQLRIVESKV